MAGTITSTSSPFISGENRQFFLSNLSPLQFKHFIPPPDKILASNDTKVKEN
jgi:hypothetical protein